MGLDDSLTPKSSLSEVRKKAPDHMNNLCIYFCNSKLMCLPAINPDSGKSVVEPLRGVNWV